MTPTRRRIRHTFLCLILLNGVIGCGTLPNGRGWGEDATLFPGFARLGKAAANAATDPYTWAPAAGAAVFGLTELDDRLSDYASNHKPLFHTADRAETASDNLKTAAGIGTVLTGLSTPSGNEPVTWAASKLKGLGVELTAWTATSRLTLSIKGWTDRERPDESDRESFPSLHSSKAFAYAALGRKNTTNLPISTPPKRVLEAGFVTLAAGTAWARLEAEKHYPSDVLAGAALGNFLAVFLHDAFLGLDHEGNAWLSVEPVGKGYRLSLKLAY